MAADHRFGFGLKLDRGDVAFETNSANKLVLTEVGGTENLAQALVLRLQTPLGNDRFNPNYGLDIGAAFTQAASARAVRSVIKLSLVRTLGVDARVSDVQEVLFEDDPEYRARHPEVTDQHVRDIRHQRVWKVDVLIRTIDGDIQLLSVDVGGLNG